MGRPEDAKAEQSPGGPPRDFWVLEHDPAWLAGRLGVAGRAVLLAMKHEEPFCGVYVHDVGLDLGLGEVSLGTVPVRRHVLTGGLPREAAAADELAELLRLLAAEIGPKGVVFLQGVHDDEALRVAIDGRELRRSYFVLQHGPSYRRCRIALGGSFDDYLATLKKGARTDLKRIMRKFTGEFGRDMAVEVVETERDLEAVLPELERLSAKTYQAKHLGLGVSPGSLVEQQLRFGARQGMARLDLLRVGGQLISFQTAYIHSTTLYALHCGYDPEWSDWGPGIAHLGFILEDLCRSLPRVRTVDMMYGESLYKTKLCNTFHQEAHFYLIPRTARGFAPWLALRTVGHMSRAAGAVAARMKHKKTVTRFIRRLAERRAGH
ncbi:MAG: GNAT family N-acetyltransferase [Candidatus Rokuibacteriota bacterium]